MKLAWINRLDGATLTTQYEIASLPVQNIQHEHVAQYWDMGSDTGGNFVIDLGAQYSIRVFAMLGTNLTASSGQFRLRANDSDPTFTVGNAYDSGSVDENDVGWGVNDNYGDVYHDLGSDITAQNWRVDVLDTSLFGTGVGVRVGRAFLGPAWTPTRGFPFGWSVGFEDLTTRTRSRGGQVFIDQNPQLRILQFGLNFMNEAEMYGNAFEMARAAGLHTDVLVIPDETGTYKSEQCIYGLIRRAEPLVHETHNVYRMRYEIEERL